MNWSSLFVVGILGLLGLWVAFSFLNKKGLYLFSILAIVLSLSMAQVQIYSTVSMAIVLMPLVFFAMLICFEKYGKEEAQKMFYVSLVTIGVLFVFVFFQSAYVDANIGGQVYLTWKYLGPYIALAISYVLGVGGAYYLNDKISWMKVSKYLRRSIIVSIASAINCVMFVFLTKIGQMSFGSIILFAMITLLITVLMSFATSYLAKYLNRKPAAVEISKKKNEEVEIEIIEKEEKTEKEEKSDDNK